MTDTLEAPTALLDTLPAQPPVYLLPNGKPPRDRDAGRAKRRQIPIRCYIGGNGHGKSLAAVHDLLPSLAAGRKVFSTARLVDPATGEDHPSFELFEDFSQIMTGKHFDVLADEVIGIASSRESGTMAPEVGAMLNQLRRRDVTFSWTAPAWMRADKIIRECTQGVTTCVGMFSKAAQQRDGENEIRAWNERRLFRWETHSAADFDEWTASKGQQRRAEIAAWFWRPGSLAEVSYDTLDAVSDVSLYGAKGGICGTCQGRIVRHQCKGHG
jgi:hypothetical protein